MEKTRFPGQDRPHPAVSEVIGTILLMGIVVIGIAFTATLLLSQPLPTTVPHFNAIITNQSKNVYILHKGGDPLYPGTFQVLVDGVDMTSSFTNNGNSPWSIGETLYATLPSMPGSVALVLNGTGGGPVVLLSQDLIGQKTIPNPSSIDWFNYSATGRCDWEFRKTITVHASGVAGSLSDFPVLINLAADPDLAASARADGKGIVFTAADGTTKLPHEIESFTKATGALAAWVKVPGLSPTQDTVLWMYYGNTGTDDNQDVTNVWDANYKAVWHLEEAGTGAAGEYQDSTTNGNGGQGGGGTVAQVPSRVAGEMDFAQQFDGSNDNIQAGSAASIDDIFGSGGTLSAWIYPSSIGESSEGRIGDKASGATGQTGWSFATYTNNVLMFRKGFANTRGYWRTPTNSVTLNAWNYVVVTYNQASAANNPAIYINGQPQVITEVQTPAGAAQSDAANSLQLGNRGTGYTFSGIIDEIRASKTVRSPAWIRTEYTNQADPSGFISPGSEESWWKC